MIALFTKIRDKHALWYKIIVFVSSVAFCAYLLPTQNNYIPHISAGDVWTGNDLISTTDFLIKKTNAELKEDELQHRAQNKLYFTKSTVNTQELAIDLLNEHKSEYADVLKKSLDSIYQIGLYYSTIDLPPHSDSIYLVTGNEAQPFLFSQLVTEANSKLYLENVIKNKELLERILVSLPANVEYNQELNTEIKTVDASNNTQYKSKVNKGDVLLQKNDIVSLQQEQVISNYLTELKSVKSNHWIYLGNLLVSFFVLSIIILYLAFFRKVIFSQNTHVTFILLVIVTFILVTHIVCLYDTAFVFAVPYCLVPIIIRVFFDSRTALFSFLNVVLLSAFFAQDKFEFVFIELIAGIGTIFSVADMGKRSKLLTSAVLTFLFYSLAFAAYHLVNDTALVLQQIKNYYPFLVSAMCVLFAFPLIFLFEKAFGFISDFTLLELCDLNSPLLRELSQKVPGTFQHSLQVANLAEEACYKIGGNALLVRAGAMYHDIGKITNPRFFIENQVGEVSPHNDLTPQESAKIIISHVIKGIEIAKENNLPELIIDFIRTHHGTTTTRYFLHNYKKEHEGEVINENMFRYPGPIPFSKETAILMMADGVEAASRSLKKYDAISIDDLVDNVINHLINANQFLNADITFRDIHQIKRIFKKRLMNIYHVRIEYPR